MLCSQLHAFALDRQKIAASAKPMAFAEACVRRRDYPGCFGGIVTVRRWRPLARRRLSTLRPPGVAILARKP